jgi:glutamine synthetase
MVLLPVVEDIVRALEKVDVDVQKFHAEAAPGQWEFVLPPKSSVEAVDMLVRARETIAVIAEQHGLRATLHPRPWADQAGTGAHVHISATPVGYSNSKKSESFFAGIMAHLPSISPFLLPLDDSYQRVISGIWSGGEHVCWGWDNKEAPLRRVTKDRFELKMVCGTANPYVAMSALLASGLDGVEKRLPLVGGDCQKPAAEFTEEERQELKMTKLPNNLDDALQLLQEDKAVVDLLGVSLVSAYIVITKEWNQYLREMSTEEKRNCLLSTY